MTLHIKKFSYAIIEDAIDVANGINEYFDEYKNWECVGKWRSLTHSMVELKRRRPDLLVMDWHIKGGSTYEVLDWIEKEPDYNPYIIYITAYQADEPEIPQTILNQYKVDKYITKPIWQHFSEYLNLYMKQAETKTIQKKGILIKDIEQNVVKIFPNQITTISHFCSQKRSKLIRFTNSSIEVKATFAEIIKLLDNLNIDYFPISPRFCIVIKENIKLFDGEYLYFETKPIQKVKVDKRKKKDVEKWLGYY